MQFNFWNLLLSPCVCVRDRVLKGTCGVCMSVVDPRVKNEMRFADSSEIEDTV
jgi:hypothetical protein